MSVGLDRKSKSAGKSKISQFNIVTGSVDEQVLWLEIAMENSVLVQVDERLKDLVEEALRLLLG